MLRKLFIANRGEVALRVARTGVMAYDASVLAGTQGLRNHQKTDRLLGLALRNRLPVLLWAEGGGGRPGDTAIPIFAGLHVGTFAALARLSGKVPLIGMVGGRCFAGNAALLGCCDVIVATKSCNIGMGVRGWSKAAGWGSSGPSRSAPRRCSGPAASSTCWSKTTPTP